MKKSAYRMPRAKAAYDNRVSESGPYPKEVGRVSGVGDFAKTESAYLLSKCRNDPEQHRFVPASVVSPG